MKLLAKVHDEVDMKQHFLADKRREK